MQSPPLLGRVLAESVWEGFCPSRVKRQTFVAPAACQHWHWQWQWQWQWQTVAPSARAPGGRRSWLRRFVLRRWWVRRGANPGRIARPAPWLAQISTPRSPRRTRRTSPMFRSSKVTSSAGGPGRGRCCDRGTSVRRSRGPTVPRLLRLRQAANGCLYRA